jgi:hypothetical protein
MSSARALTSGTVVIGLALTVGPVWSPGHSLAATRGYAVEARAVVQESPPRIDFSWRADGTATEYRVLKKAVGDTAWAGPIAVLDGSATSFADEDVAVGEAYEYSFRKTRGVIRDTVQVASGSALTFTIRDSWGDGICCDYSVGWYQVTGCGTVYVSGGAFGFTESTVFVVGSPEEPCDQVVVVIALDIFGTETTWDLVENGTGTKLAEGGPYSSPRFGHILAGVRYGAPEDLGMVLLLVDEPLAAPLAPEIARLEVDLVRDGYRVLRRNVADGASVLAVKDLILAECTSDPTISTLFLLGDIAVPYSGNVQGTHADQQGAWPADVYYGDLDGVWTDLTVDNTAAARPKYHNVPGDGKFDQTYLPSDVELMVGRVDLSDMPAFSLDEVGLVRRYLDKDHAYRSGTVEVPRRGLIRDNTGEMSGAAYACTGWRNFTAMFGPGTVSTGAWLPTLESSAYMCAFGSGGGSYTSCSGVVTTADFATRTIYTVFPMLMGSYFGDWDTSDNLMRAALGSAGYPLACFWAGAPAWHLHHMAMGYPVGYSARLTQNNYLSYMIGYHGWQIHIALMGDPTLKMCVVKPPVGLSLENLPAGQVGLEWRAPQDSVVGYNVYRAPSLDGHFVRLNLAPVGDTTYIDASPPSGQSAYMVRAMKLETTGSGTYFNLSAGAIDSISLCAGVDSGVGDGLLGNFPNPFGASTRVGFLVGSPGPVTLKVYDAVGRLVRTVEGGELPPGRHFLDWDGRDDRGHRAASGVYFLLVSTGRTAVSSKVVKLE